MKPADLDAVIRGYLECAEFADKPEGSRARFTKHAEQQARAVCERFVADAGALADAALASPGYSAERFGADLWFTRCGHGCGFWDRDELASHDYPGFPTPKDRDGKPYTVPVESSIGDCLSAIAYGTDNAISPYAYPNLECYRGWMSFCGSVEFQSMEGA